MTDLHSLKERIETAGDWQPIETAPKDGTRIRVKHELGTYGFGQTTAAWDGERWACSEFFIDPHTMRMYRQPTHWKPALTQDHGDENE